MDTERERTQYALTQQVPDMNRGFLIHTSYGDIDISAEESASVVQAVRSVLKQRLLGPSSQVGAPRYAFTLGE
ncbi:hypothetical protein CDEF62S_03970 [Castellaniella defragrans]